MEEKLHNVFYKITNLVNGKYYYGIHSTNNLEDGYFGSGKILLKALRKYGKEGFVRVVVADYPSRKEASDHEARIVTKELTQLEECYNTRTGGDNEFTHSEHTKNRLRQINTGKILSVETRKKMSSFQRGREKSTEHRDKISRSLTGEAHPLFGKRHSEKTRKKMKDSHSGSKNHYFGKFNQNPRSKPCVIMQRTYLSITDAARQLNLPVSTVKCRVLSKSNTFKDWTYCE